MSSCDTCVFYIYDEDYETYCCDVDIDEDDFFRLQSRNFRECPFYHPEDEYAVVRHQA